MNSKMQLFIVLFGIFLISGGASGLPKRKTCSHWCSTPDQVFYCCDDDPFTQVHSGHCPAVLDTSCFQSQAFGDNYEPPKICSTDKDCRHSEKCCKDNCIRDKVCKPAVA